MGIALNVIQFGCGLALDGCAGSFSLARKALDNVPVSNKLFGTVELVSRITTLVLEQLGKPEEIPAFLEPLGKAFKGFGDVVSGIGVIKSIDGILNGDFAWANPIGIYPNFFAIGSRILGLGNDLVGARKWAGRVGLLPLLENTIGSFSVFGVEGRITVAGCQDVASFASSILDLTDNCRLLLQAVRTGNGGYVGRGLDVVSSALRVASLVLDQFSHPYTQIASTACKLVSNSIYLGRWTVTQIWVPGPAGNRPQGGNNLPPPPQTLVVETSTLQLDVENTKESTEKAEIKSVQLTHENPEMTSASSTNECEGAQCTLQVRNDIPGFEFSPEEIHAILEDDDFSIHDTLATVSEEVIL